MFFHIGSLIKPYYSFITASMLSASIGAEMIFIHAQKVLIGRFCPLCLSIAACVAIASVCYLLSYINNTKFYVNESFRSETMVNLNKGISTIFAMALGFTFAFIGLGKVDEMAAAENSIKNSIAFGDLKSDVDVYFFSDWQCPACRQVETKLDKIIPVISQKAKITFADFAIHQSTMNFTPYNLSFMIHDKSKYIELRDGLTKISEETDSPTEEQVVKMAAAIGVNYKQLNYADVETGLKYFKTLSDEFDLNSTPTVVIVNEKTKKGKKLYGVAEITAENISSAIDKLRQ